jgi:hypothetical protein
MTPGAMIAAVNLAAWAAAVAVVCVVGRWACRVAVAAWRWGWLTLMREEW